MENDHRYMAAAIRLARRHEGLTGTNPSVACLIVREGEGGARIVGAGVTALGGRPHAEPVALTEAGDLARGATAYVTLEPCAHHGRTPPCAQTLIDGGIARVVTAVTDPDDRVRGRGHAMLREAGIATESGLLASEAVRGLQAYLIQKAQKRAQVTLKLAVSADGYLGERGAGQVAITGPVARAQSHLLRAMHHAILVGCGTVVEDDPELTCRLPGLEHRSPVRIVLDPAGRIPVSAKLVRSARRQRTIIGVGENADPAWRSAMIAAGVELLPVECLAAESSRGELTQGRIALPELLEDLAAIGIHSVLVEGGAQTAAAFLDAGLADAVIRFEGAASVHPMPGAGIASPLADCHLDGFEVVEELALGEDRMTRYMRC